MRTPSLAPQTRHIKTLTVPVWKEDYPLLKFGHKTEYRSMIRGQSPPVKMLRLEFPRPILMYTTNHAGRLASTLMVIEKVWDEPIMGITAESIRSEGFENVEAFKHYWMLRTGKRPRPIQPVRCRRLRIWQPDDTLTFGSQVLGELYGEAFDEALRAEA